MINALTIDVEDYFHVTAFEKNIRTEDWDNYSLRVVDNTFKILDLLDEVSIKATFFVLGWVAERRPLLIQEIHKRGHEIACHGYGHQLVYRIGYDEFRKDVRRAKSIIENICGERVQGYRAPSYSITKKSLWALDVLIEEGFTYDSSIFPVLHDIYGMPEANRFPCEMSTQSGIIKEFPLSTLQIKIANIAYKLPIAGGGYLRLFPAWVTKMAVDHINRHERQSAVIYFHPWEIDPEQPRIKTSLKSRFRHYLNIDTTAHKIRYLLRNFKFSPMGTVLGI
jgi:polysaccharide deacetylase family protein (PEP-CTERM system associated)